MIKKIKFKNLLIIIIIFCLIPKIGFSQNSYFNIISKKKDNKFKNLVLELAKNSLNIYLNSKKYLKPDSKKYSNLFNYPNGVIITLTLNKKTVGCRGTIYPCCKTLKEEIVRSTILAVSTDERFLPIMIKNADNIKIAVSIIGNLRKVNTKYELNPLKYGLLVVKGTKTGLLLPNEVFSPNYQIEECKRKAGIPLNEKVEMFIFETILIK